jgi:hypothetical protein
VTVGEAVVFNAVFDDKQSNFIIKLVKAELGTATVETAWIHQHPKEKIEVNVTKKRSISTTNYAIESRKPSSATIQVDHWMTFCGYPMKNDERLILRITK